MSRISRFFFALAFVVLAAVQPGIADELYVANSGANTVTNIVTNGSKMTSIAVDGNPYDAVATADGAYVYVSCPTANAVRVIRAADNAVVATIVIPSSPAKMAIGNGDTRLYVANKTLLGPHITIVNIAQNPDGTRANVVIGSIDLSAAVAEANSATTVATYFNAATGQSLLAVGTQTAHTLLYNTATVPATFIGRLIFGTTVSHLIFSGDGVKLYNAMTSITNSFDSLGNPIFGNLFVANTSEINTTTNYVKSGLDLGTGSQLGYAALSGTSLYLTGSTFGEVYLLDTASDALTTTFSLGGQPYGIAATTTAVYTGLQATDVIQIIRRGRIDGTITLPIGSDPTGVVVLPPAPKGKGKP